MTIVVVIYLSSAVIVVLSKPCVGPSPRTKIFFLLLSTCTDEPISAPKITVLPQLMSVHENCERELNQVT